MKSKKKIINFVEKNYPEKLTDIKKVIENYEKFTKSEFFNKKPKNIIDSEDLDMIIFKKFAINIANGPGRFKYYFITNKKLLDVKKLFKLLVKTYVKRDNKIYKNIFTYKRLKEYFSIYDFNLIFLYFLLDHFELFIDNIFGSFFDYYLEPFDYKNIKFLKSNLKCNETKNGIIRGLSHKILHGNVINLKLMLRKNIFKIFNRQDGDWNNGIYTSLIPYDEKINNKGITLIFSNALLDDYDYYGNSIHDFGVRDENSFFKNLSSNKKFSAAELALINYGTSAELIFTDPIPLDIYLEKIIIEDREDRDIIKKDKKIDKKYKEMIISKDDGITYYQSLCIDKIKPNKKLNEMIKNKITIKNSKIPLTKKVPKLDPNSLAYRIKPEIMIDKKYLYDITF